VKVVNSTPADVIRVVLADANVLYSRVLRDYLLYAAQQGLLVIRWSPQILAEMIEHLIANRPQFSAESGRVLAEAMNSAFPAAEVSVDADTAASLVALDLPDKDDRHVLAAAILADADVLCTNNLKDFPNAAMQPWGIAVMSADELLNHLIKSSPREMIAVHRIVVENHPSATDESTLAALRRAKASLAADSLDSLLGTQGDKHLR